MVAYDLIWPNHPNDIHVYRTIPRLLMKTPPEVTPGSKFKASVTSFDGVDVRLYEPLHKRTELLPGFIYIHGGGYCIMNTGMPFKMSITRLLCRLQIDGLVLKKKPFKHLLPRMLVRYERSHLKVQSLYTRNTLISKIFTNQNLPTKNYQVLN